MNNEDFKTIQKWEKENNAFAIFEDGVLGVEPTKTFSLTENGEKVFNRQEVLVFSIWEETEPGEKVGKSASTLITKKEDIIRLRDYLTKFIEKDEDWFDIEKFEENN